MSSFKCEKCGTNIIDTTNGYMTECKHYPFVSKQFKVSNIEKPYYEAYKALINGAKKKKKYKDWEEELYYQISLHKSLPTPLRQYKFNPKRKWIADFAWPDKKILVEVQGATWVQGRHTRGAGYKNDCDKLNNAQILGWEMLWFTSEHIKSGEAIEIIKEALR